jgi:hypothetical protein
MAAMEHLCVTYSGTKGRDKAHMEKCKALVDLANASLSYPSFHGDGRRTDFKEAAGRIRRELSIDDIKRLTAEIEKDSADAKKQLGADRPLASSAFEDEDAELVKVINAVDALFAEEEAIAKRYARESGQGYDSSAELEEDGGRNKRRRWS